MTRARKKNRPDADARARRREAAYDPEDKEEMLDNLWGNPQGIADWFEEPWRDGRYAAKLCLNVGRSTSNFLGGTPLDDTATRAIRWLEQFFMRSNFRSFEPQDWARRAFTTKDYDEADALRYELSRTSRPNNVFLEAAMRIVGNWIANSDGGGHVPNGHLNSVFWARLQTGDIQDQVALETVGEMRAADLGLDWFSTSGRTFRWFWMNQRYRMAMSLPSKGL